MMETKVFESAAQLVTALADELQKISECKRAVHVALSGGSTPTLWFEFLAASAFRDSIHWSHIHFWWGDERCVPPENPESNYGTASRLLFQKVNVEEENIHRIHGEEDPQVEKLRLSKELGKRLPIVNGLPQFDWIILGVGEDGHTASLFPGQYSLNANETVVAVRHPETGQARLSLTAPVIENARRVSYLAMGRAKRIIVNQILADRDPGLCSHLPAARIQSREGDTEWWLDRESALGIEGVAV
jgi:6-phosphogluconolactonase